MVLSDQDIRKALASKRIIIKPTPDFTRQLGSCSIDLRLGNTFRVFDYGKHPYIDPSKKDYSNEITKVIKVQKDGTGTQLTSKIGSRFDDNSLAGKSFSNILI